MEQSSWVQALPENYPGKMLLTRIEANHKGAINEPYHALFTISGTTEPKDLIIELETRGWICEIDENWTGPGRAIDAQNKKYIFSKEKLDADVRFFVDFAKQRGWEYQGWSVIFPIPVD